MKSDAAWNKNYLENAAEGVKKRHAKLRQLAENNGKVIKNNREENHIRKKKSRERIKKKAHEEKIWL